MHADFSFEPADTEMARLIRSRRTIHDFRPQVPPRELILQAIELARWAPNHKLTQPWRFHLLGPDSVAKVIELNSRMTEAAQGAAAAETKRRRWLQIPGWIVGGYLRSDDPVMDQENYAAMCCAIQNFNLFLWSQGVGVKWSTGSVTRRLELYRLLDIDSRTQTIAGLLWYGYPAHCPDMKRLDVAKICLLHP